jgi:type I restriction enzyme M protein
MGKTNPLNDGDLADFLDQVAHRASTGEAPVTDKSWCVDVADIDRKTFDLSVKNPNGGKEVAHRSPQEILEEIERLDGLSAKVLMNIRALL